jgi:hypothetical protein
VKKWDEKKGDGFIICPFFIAEMMSLKSSSRDRQVDAVYAADPQSLAMAAARAKAVLHGNSRPIARPQRFSALSN